MARAEGDDFKEPGRGVMTAPLFAKLAAVIFSAVVVGSPGAAARSEEPTPQSATAIAKSFEAIADRFDQFFRSPQKTVHRENVPWAPSGHAYFVRQYTAIGTSYDVKSTQSLISPFVGIIETKILGYLGPDLCGSYKQRGLPGFWGWATAQDAFAAASRSECFPSKTPSDYVYRVEFTFALQGGRWVLKSIRNDDHAPLEPSQHVMGMAMTGVDNDEPAMASFNSPWRALVAP